MKLNPFKLERFFAEYEFSAPYLLGCSDCESFSTSEILEMAGGDAKENFQSLWLGYTETAGSPELRAEISSLYENIAPEQVLVHSGAGEGIFNFMHSLLESGDHVVIHSPYYQALGEVALGIGASLTEWVGDPNDRWKLDIDFLRNSLTDRTKVVVINIPHNPTGFLPDRKFLEELSALSDERGFVVFSDEVYRGLEYDSSDRLPAFAEMNERAVSLGVMSKTYGLAGLRIGWVLTQNTELYQKMATFKDYTTLCSSAPSEYLATVALQNSEAIVSRNLSIIRENLVLLEQFFSGHREWFEWYSPKAGPIAFPRILRQSPMSFCRDLVEKAGVLLIPGTLYGDGYDNVRFGFGRKNLPQCIEKLSEYLTKV